MERRHFDTIEAIEVEPQAVVSTPTKHDFLKAFNKLQKRCEGTRGKGLLRG
jgi:hypothetical protein